MEGVYRFPLLRLKPSDAPPPFVMGLYQKHFCQNMLFLEYFGYSPMTNKRVCLGLNAQNSSKAPHRFSQSPPKIAFMEVFSPGGGDRNAKA